MNAPFHRGKFGDGIRLVDIIVTTSSMAGTLVITAGLGFPFWWVAARLFAPDAVGIASAAISAMLLLGSIATFGMESLLVRELARSPGHERALITWALTVASTLAIGVGLLFAVIAPSVSTRFGPLATPVSALVFVFGVSMTAVSIVLDQAFVGLLRSELQFVRNLVFALLKILLLVPLAVLLTGGNWLGIYIAWGASIAASLLVITVLASVRRAVPPSAVGERIRVLHFGPSAASHFLLNLTLQLSTLGMPILVTAIAGAQVNAAFYIAWLVASAAGMIPFSLSSTLYAIGSRAPEALRHQVRLTLGLAFGAAFAATAFLALLGGAILQIFGSHYASSAPALVLFAAATVPTVVKNHFQVLLRIEGRVVNAAVVCGFGAALELFSASVGLEWGGIEGLAAGWLLALMIEAVVMSPVVIHVATRGPTPSPAIAQD